MGLARIARRAGTGLALLVLGLLAGFLGGLFRRRAPSPYPSDRPGARAVHEEPRD